MKLLYVFIVICLITIITGCAYSNEGAVDLRKVSANATALKNAPACDADKKCKGLRDYEFMLHHKNLSLGADDETLFKVGDSLSIHLRTVFIKEVADSPFVEPYIQKIGTRQWSKVQGEVAIVANAFEMNGKKELSFKDMRDGRVVFYSDDVNEGQFLNFNNMPVYGPMEYKGYPVALRTTILELDETTAQSKEMLKTLSEFGGKAYPPSDPILKVLNGLGDTLMSGDQTDTEFRYSMILDPNHGSTKLNHFTLEVGNYILLRREEREEAFDWSKVYFNENEGRLYKFANKSNADEANKEKVKGDTLFTDETYIVLEINKRIATKNVELAELNYGSLLTALRKVDTDKASNWKATENVLKSISIEKEQASHFIDAKTELSNAKTKKEQITKLDTNTPAYQSKRVNLIINAREHVTSLLTLISDSYDKKIHKGSDSESPAKLTQVQINYLFRELRLLAGNALTDKNYSLLQADGFIEKHKENKLSLTDLSALLDMTVGKLTSN